MSSGTESYAPEVSGVPNFGVNKVDVFSKPPVTGGLPMRAIALGLTAVIVVGGGYFGVTKLTAAYESNSTAASSSVPAGVKAQSLFIQKVDGLCASAFAQVEALMVPTTLAEFGPWADRVVVINKNLYADVAALKAPARDRKLLNKVLAGWRTEIRFVEHELIPAINAVDAAAFQASLGKMQKLAKRNAGQALRYGFTECGAPR